MKMLTALSLAALLGTSASPKPSESAPSSRVISFTTNEGTWISLDVSPDGRTIVFELLGDIYAIPIDGGAPRAILTGTAFQSQPRFSPDGRSLVYVSDGSGSDNVWIASADGTNPRQVSEIGGRS